jgi:cell wall assembly regulator SMI1
MKVAELYREIVELIAPNTASAVFGASLTESRISELELLIGKPLPPDLKELYVFSNGEIDGADGIGVFFDYHFLSLEAVARKMAMLDAVAEYWSRFPDAIDISSRPANAVKCVVYSSGWLPFATDGNGNYLAIDFSPAESGTPGQVISFGRDDYIYFRISESFTEFLLYVRRCYLKGIGHRRFGESHSFYDQLVVNPDILKL